MRSRCFTLSLLAAAAAISLSGAVHAADLYTPPVVEQTYAPPADVWSWTGVYFSAGVGGQFDSSSSYGSVFDTFDGEDFIEFEGDVDGAAFFATFDVGADYQMQNWVAGIFANYDWHPENASDSHGAEEVGDTIDNEVEWGDAWGIGGRLGFLVTNRTLLYGLGGYGQKDINATNSTNIDFGGEFEFGGWRPGWFVGVGGEYRITKDISFKAEYRYARYSGFDDSIPCGGICDDGDLSTIDVDDTDSHTIRALLSVRWGP